MKMRIVSIVFCLIAFAVSLILMFNIYNHQVTPVIEENENKQNEVSPPEQERTEPVTEASVKKLSADVSSFVNSLAYSSDKSYETKIRDYINQLNAGAEFLATEKKDTAGQAYLAKVAGILTSVADAPYMTPAELSAGIGTYLKEIEASKPQSDDAQMYPQIDTDVNGAFTLAMIAINNSKKPADVFTVSVGGGVVLGDVAGATENTFASEYEKYNSATFPLGGTSAVFASDDYSIVTLRNPLTEETASENTRTAVKGRPGYATMLSAAGINAVNIASDHIGDYGDKGLSDTKIALSNAGIHFATNAEVRDYDTQIGKVSLISYNLNSSAVSNNANAVNSTVKEAIASARTRGAVMVITMFSWKGNENKEISDYQVSVGRSAIDNGADLVVGTFPQHIQAVDVYKGKTLIYSTNDLINAKTDILDTKNTPVLNSLIISQDYTYIDGVLTPSEITFYPVVSSSEGDRNNFMPKLVFDETADSIIDTFKKACVCTKHGIAKETNPAKQEIKYIRISK